MLLPPLIENARADVATSNTAKDLLEMRVELDVDPSRAAACEKSVIVDLATNVYPLTSKML